MMEKKCKSRGSKKPAVAQTKLVTTLPKTQWGASRK